MKTDYLSVIRSCTDRSEPVPHEAALAVFSADTADLPSIMACTASLRFRHFGNKVHLCSILNAKSGACTEDCAFCAQSACHDTGADIFDMCSSEKMKAAYDEAGDLPIGHFGVVTSGGALDSNNIDAVCEAVRTAQEKNIHWCASLGSLSLADLKRLKQAGLKRFHHNLETSRSFFPQICSTHSYDDRLKTLHDAREVGLELCCGGIFGLGESLEQRIEFAETLQTEKVNSIPMNFHIPVPGTRLEKLPTMSPVEILKTIAVFRLMNPEAEIKVCAGRVHLRSMQSMIFQAGATGMMIGPLLTVAGGDVDSDLQMLKDLEMEVAD